MMNQEQKEYIASLIPEGFPDGRVLLKEGYEIGKNIEVEPTNFTKATGYSGYMEYRKALRDKGECNYQILLGLANLENQLEGIQMINEFSERNNTNLKMVMNIANQAVGLPQEYWDKMPKQTSYLMKAPEDWRAHADVSNMCVCWEDWHLTAPTSLTTTVNAVKAGAPRLGTFSTFIWNFPGWDDEVNRFSDMMRSMGILAARRDSITCDTYCEDGIPGYFLDVASYVGYTLFEHYIIEDLCGAKMSQSYGGLLTEPIPRMAYALAIHRLLAKDDDPILSFYNGGTVRQWDHDVNANYGSSVLEMFLEICFEKRYKLGGAISPVAVTEAQRTPSCQELIDIAGAAIQSEELAEDWLKLLDFTPIEEMAEILMEKGKLFCENMKSRLAEAGVNIEDPLEIIMVLRHFNYTKMEEIFSPSVDEFGEFRPYVPSVLGRQTMDMKDRILNELRECGYGNALAGKKVVAVSADGHSYGLLLVDTVLSSIGAKVINGGVDMRPQDILDLADESGTDLIMISAHNGQGLGLSQQIMDLISDRDRDYTVFLGGMLNALLEGHDVPVDVTDKINEIGVHATNNLKDFVKYVLER